MYYLDDILSEAVLLNSKSEQINKLFDFSMRQIFTPIYYNKINKVLGGNRIEVNEFKSNNNMVAYTQAHKLYVNAHVFYSKKRNDAIVYILHEMIHLLTSLPQFKELKQLEKQVYSLVRKNLNGSFSEFLTGKKQPLHSDERNEVLSYSINGAMDWSVTKTGTKEKYKQLLEESGIFKISSPFWSKRFK